MCGRRSCEYEIQTLLDYVNIAFRPCLAAAYVGEACFSIAFCWHNTTDICVNREKAGVELGGGSYLIHKIYDDEETLRLVAATCETLGRYSVHIFNIDTAVEVLSLRFCFVLRSGFEYCS